MNNNYKVIKLSNGDDIICKMVNHVGDKYVIGEPLKMQVHDDETLGNENSLSLTAWLAPFTENKTFEIKESHIIVITDASFGLTSYYKILLNEGLNLNYLMNWKNGIVQMPLMKMKLMNYLKILKVC